MRQLPRHTHPRIQAPPARQTACTRCAPGVTGALACWTKVVQPCMSLLTNGRISGDLDFPGPSGVLGQASG